MNINWLKKREAVLAIVIIALTFVSVIYGIVQSNTLKNVVECNKRTIQQLDQALIIRDNDKVAADESSLRADDARQKVILSLLDNYENGGSVSISTAEIRKLRQDYLAAVNKRAADLRRFIEGARKAPLPTYACS